MIYVIIGMLIFISTTLSVIKTVKEDGYFHLSNFIIITICILFESLFIITYMKQPDLMFKQEIQPIGYVIFTIMILGLIYWSFHSIIDFFNKNI